MCGRRWRLVRPAQRAGWDAGEAPCGAGSERGRRFADSSVQSYGALARRAALTLARAAHALPSNQTRYPGRAHVRVTARQPLG